MNDRARPAHPHASPTHCPACGARLAHPALAMDLAPGFPREHLVAVARCACGFAGLYEFRETQEGGQVRLSQRALPLDATRLARVERGLLACPGRWDLDCGCAAHRTLAQAVTTDDWTGFDAALDSP